MIEFFNWKNHRDVAGTSMLVVVCLTLFLFAFNGLTGCAAFKSNIKTIDNIASDLCLFAASEQPQEQLNGLSPADFCAVKKHLQPFIDEALAAKMAASSASGFSAPESGDAGTD